MKAVIVNMVSAAGLLIAGSVMAVDMPELSKKYGCYNCHTVEKKLVGPGWQEVANKYKGNASAAAILSAKIVNGGEGVWGSIPMPPSKITEPELKELVTFILGLAK